MKKTFVNIKKNIKFLLWKIGIRKTIKPPHKVKENTIKFYQKKFKIDTLIETGTYEGEMVYALKGKFKQIFSIELNNILAKKAKRKFIRFKNIKIIQGSSDLVLPKILKTISNPCLFWLDAHYSGGKTSKGIKETPILEELKEIVKHSPKNLILIDDADNFGKGHYPSIKVLNEIVNKYFYLACKNNIIQLIPKRRD